MSELKPCPFCGGKARIDTEYDMDGFGNFHKVECSDCGASSKPHFATQGNECPQYYQEVRDDWQNRTDDKLKEENTKLKEMLKEIKHNFEVGNSDHHEINDEMIPRIKQLLGDNNE